MYKNLSTASRTRRFAGNLFASIMMCSMMLLLRAPVVSFAQQASRTQSAPATTNSKLGGSERNDAAALYQSLLDLQNSWTVMCVAAHPDDEDGATLTILRRKYGAHTVSLFSTYGEGGQNAIGPELYEELGAIRARETMEAATVQGSEPHFLGLRDFGFSKSADEAFRVWNHDEALRRMVYQIRLLRPDVIITNHDTVSGHGHHQATGRLVLEAFDAAADPKRFPEQLKEFGNPHESGAWQVQRLFVRAYDEGSTGSKPLKDEAARANATISYDANELDAVRGTTYAEQALEALRHHATQGPWPQRLPAGARIIRYRLARSARGVVPLPAGAQTFTDELRLTPEIAARLSPPTINNRPLTDFANERTRVLATLIAASKSAPYNPPGYLEASPDVFYQAHRFALMQQRFFRALAAVSGISMTLSPRDKTIVPNSPTAFSVSISNHGDAAAQASLFNFGTSEYDFGFTASSLPTPIKSAPKQLSIAPGTNVNAVTINYAVPPAAHLTTPHAEHLYDGNVFGERFGASAWVESNGARFVLFASTCVDVAPTVEITSITPSPFVLTPATLRQPPAFAFRLVNHLSTPFAVGLEAKSSVYNSAIFFGGFKLKASEIYDGTMPFGYLTSEAYTQPRGRSLKPVSDTITFTLHRSFNSTGELITRRKVPIIYSDARVAPNLRVGYVRSSDETLRNALAAMGVEAKELTIDDVRSNDLSRYDTIIIDNRGYQAHPELIALNQRLLDYARAGGNLIVFYHKTNEWNPDARVNRSQLAPYPILLGNERVTDETAPVTFLEPNNELLNYPNRITQDDFKDWIQERGLYYPKEWDAHYTALFASNDSGEASLRGGLLATDYGRGHYIYTSMVWYRQLRAGVPGAYRMFANMISYGRAGKGVRQTRAVEK